jgi:hypothetical protein
MSETAALQVIEQRAVVTREAIDAASEQRKLISEFIHRNMQEGHDFGIIPGTQKPTLYKPGAEKLVDLFRCTPGFTLVRSVEDFERKPPLFSYVFSVTLEQRDARAVVAEGYGSCNSLEDRYRWRKQNPQCPTCAAESLFKSKDGSGFYCWTKKGGCGAKFPLTDAAAKEAFSTAGRVENEDTASLQNTILKMAKKRALVDAAIALARVSDLFTQDTEDQKKPAAIWQQVVELAKEFHFACGEKNAALWKLAAKVTPTAPAKWSIEDLKKIEAALQEATQQENDIPF